MKKYKFWSLAQVRSCCIEESCQVCFGSNRDWVWLCIPPNKKYIPEWYPKGALIKRHKERMLPPLSYWLSPNYESIVYSQ